MIDVVNMRKASQELHGIELRTRGFFFAKWVVALMTFVLPKLERLPRWMRISDGRAEWMLKWAMTRLWVEANAGNGRWVPVANGWDHVRGAI